MQSDKPHFGRVLCDEFAFIENGVIVRHYGENDMYTGGGAQVTAFLDKETFDTYLLKLFTELRVSLVFAAFDLEARAARNSGRIVTIKRRPEESV